MPPPLGQSVHVPLAGLTHWTPPARWSMPTQMPPKEEPRHYGSDSLPQPQAILKPHSTALADWLSSWEQNVVAKGRQPSEYRIFQLEEILRGETMSARQLYELGRCLGYVHGDQLAYPCYVAAAAAAARELADARPGALTPQQQDTVDLLWAMARTLVFYKRPCQPGYQAAELLTRFEQDPFKWRQAKVLAVDAANRTYAWTQEDRSSWIEKALKHAAELHQAPHLAQASKYEIAEAHWILASTLDRAGRYSESVEHHPLAAQYEGAYFSVWAKECFVRALLECWRVEEARQWLDKWKNEGRVRALEMEYWESLVDKAAGVPPRPGYSGLGWER